MIFYFAWSLATEEQFYLAWPTVEKKARKLAPYVVIALIVGSELVRLGGTPVASGTLEYRILTSFAPALGMGVLLAHVFHNKRGFEVAYRVLGHRFSSSILAALALATLLLQWPLTILYAVFALLVAACSIREDHGLAPLLRLGPLRFVGTVSYGVYLMHMLAVNAIRLALRKAGIPPSPTLDFLGASILATAIAWLSFNYYERWFLSFKTKFERK